VYVIAFYSFKGGVGRTMALVNVAAELVRRGRKVLVVDFDLEAPGLETYQHLQPPKPHPGIVEFVTEYRRTNAVPNLLDYIYEAKPIGTKDGRLWVMPAGRRDRAYRTALANLDWQRLYKEEDGFLLFEDAKIGWEQELKPDYVLIDSRTGDTDVLGICTRQLPDSVVLMFTPNEQNLVGLENVCRDIRREETQGLKKRIRLHFVAANVPDLDDENGILRRQLKASQQRLQYFRLSGSLRRYESLRLLDQSIVVLSRRRCRLAKEYCRLIKRLITHNRGDRDGALLFLRERAHRLLEAERTELGLETSRSVSQRASTAVLKDDDDEEWAFTFDYADMDIGDLDPTISAIRSSKYKDPLDEIASHFLEDLEILNKIAECRVHQGDVESALRVLDWILRLEPGLARSLYLRAKCRIYLGDVDAAARDLLDYVGLPEQPDRDMLRALRRLRDIAPGRLMEAAGILLKGGLQGVDKVRVAEVLSESEECIPQAAQIISEYLAGLTQQQRRRAPGHCVSIETLLRARCWREAIERLEAENAGYPDSLFQLALAYWGERGLMPESLCRQALQLSAELAGEPGELSSEAQSWLLWRLGNVADALVLLGSLESADRKLPEMFSLWRQRRVTFGEYLKDCQLVRLMFNGEPLRPAFLGPASGQMG
jgi:cellulose biosynthesis protein BcsQ